MNNNINTQQTPLKVLVFDNYDSFTYNLSQVCETVHDVQAVRLVNTQ